MAKTNASPSLGERLHTARVGAKLTQKEVGARLGLSQATVWEWESDKIVPNRVQLKKLHGFLQFHTPRTPVPKKAPPSASPDDAPSAFGRWLNETRVKKGLTIVELSKKSGVGYATIANVESGRTQNPRAEARIRLIYVQSLMPLAFMEYAPADFDERVRESTEGELAKAAEQIDYPKELVSTALRFGAVYPEVLTEAETWGADLIVLGSHRPSMSTYLLGSNAKTIVRHAKCSVLVARD